LAAGAAAAIFTLLNGIDAYRERTQSEFQDQYKASLEKLKPDDPPATKASALFGIQQLLQVFPENAAPVLKALADDATALAKAKATSSSETVPADVLIALRIVTDQKLLPSISTCNRILDQDGRDQKTKIHAVEAEILQDRQIALGQNSTA